MSRRNPTLDAARDELERRGAEIRGVERTGGNHTRVVFGLPELPGRTRFLICSSTCSDVRALNRVRQDARRELGFLLSVLSPDAARAYHRRWPSKPERRSAAVPSGAAALQSDERRRHPHDDTHRR